MYWIFFIIVFIPLFFMLPIKFYGKDNIEKKQKYIVVFNHQSGFDGVILNMKLLRKIHYISKKELWKGKEKSFLFDTILGCIKVDRKKGFSLSNIKQICKYLNNNQCIGIAPEGTRIENGLNKNSQIKSGACLLAIKTKTPILPCYIDKKQKPFRKNTLVVGKPFELKEFYNLKIDKENLNKASKIVLEEMNKLKSDLENMKKEKEIIKNLKFNKKNK